MFPLVLNIFLNVKTSMLLQVKEIDTNIGKIKGYGICKKKKYNISFLGGPTTPTYSNQ